MDTGIRRVWTEKKKPVTYAACRRRKNGGFEKRKVGFEKKNKPDWVRDDQTEQDDHVWIREDQLQSYPCLEVVFVDIGQGDGCFMVTPNPAKPKDANPKSRKRFVIDAGQGDNMAHYLNWRHGQKRETFEAGIISHPVYGEFVIIA